eukprot:1148212-Pelagomonas_calceolata.AAC.2
MANAFFEFDLRIPRNGARASVGVERVTSLPPPPSSFPEGVPFVLIFGYKGDLSCKIVDLHRSFVNSFPVQVRTLAGKEFQVFVASWHLVLDLKRKIQELDGASLALPDPHYLPPSAPGLKPFLNARSRSWLAEPCTPPDRQRLVLNGQQLEDSKTCAFYKINQTAAIYLIWRLHGHPPPTSGPRSYFEGFLDSPRSFCTIQVTPLGLSKTFQVEVPCGRIGMLTENFIMHAMSAAVRMAECGSGEQSVHRYNRDRPRLQRDRQGRSVQLRRVQQGRVQAEHGRSHSGQGQNRRHCPCCS